MDVSLVFGEGHRVAHMVTFLGQMLTNLLAIETGRHLAR